MMPKWYKMKPKWYNTGTKLVQMIPKRYQNGTRLVQNDTKLVTKVLPNWYKIGTNLKIIKSSSSNISKKVVPNLSEHPVCTKENFFGI